MRCLACSSSFVRTLHCCAAALCNLILSTNDERNGVAFSRAWRNSSIFVAAACLSASVLSDESHTPCRTASALSSAVFDVRSLLRMYLDMVSLIHLGYLPSCAGRVTVRLQGIEVDRIDFRRRELLTGAE